MIIPAYHEAFAKMRQPNYDVTKAMNPQWARYLDSVNQVEDQAAAEGKGFKFSGNRPSLLAMQPKKKKYNASTAPYDDPSTQYEF